MIFTVWSNIKYAAGYLVSVDGQVVSKRIQNGTIGKKWKLLKPDTSTGYPRFVFSVGGKRQAEEVHRTVAKAFIPKVEGKNWVNHKDGNTYKNNVENLEWCTPKENERHSWEVLGKAHSEESNMQRSQTMRSQGSLKITTRVSNKVVARIKAEPFTSFNKLKIKYGIAHMTISRIVKADVINGVTYG